MNNDNVIGLNNELPWHYSADLKRFKQRTLGKTVIMGRHTWESIGGKPLPGRRNIVISHRPVKGIECYTSIERAMAPYWHQDVWIIGGGQIYRVAFEYLNLLDVTIVPDQVDSDQSIRFPFIDPAVWTPINQEPLANEPRLLNIIYVRH